MIVFNKPYLSGSELDYIAKSISQGQVSGNGSYTKLCHEFFVREYNFGKCLLTTSCTDALEMCAILANIEPGDEVIIPSYTFVSTANAFVLRGAKIVFADSGEDNPNIDTMKLEKLITPRTKAIVPVHYAGVSCNMGHLMELAEKYNLLIIEDAAQAIDSYYTFPDGSKKALGSIGHLAAFSFHETKNIISGEGGMLVVNKKDLVQRAEIIWEKGTNRAAFWRGEVDKYGWIDVGSSFLPSEMIAAFLYAQLEKLDNIQDRRKTIWNYYYSSLQVISDNVRLPNVPDFATNNAHMFYLVCKNIEERTALIAKLKSKNIHSVFHYISLHKSAYFSDKYEGKILDQSERYSDCLVRLPLFYELQQEDQELIVKEIIAFYSE